MSRDFVTEIGINVLSCAPWVMFWPQRTLDEIRNAGYRGLQVCPVRGLRLKHLTDCGLPIWSLEYPWHHSPGDRRRWRYKLRDQVLFQWRQAAVNFCRAIDEWPVDPIVHQLEELDDECRYLLEVTPDLGLTVQQIADYWPQTGLVIDTAKLRLPAGRFEKNQHPSPLGDWQDSLPALLATKRVTMLHVAPARHNQDELSDCLEGRSTELAAMLNIIKHSGWRGPAIVEATLGRHTHNWLTLRRDLIHFHSWVERHLCDC